jgi:molybdate transport system permease protein
MRPLSEADLDALWVTLQLAGLTTLILLLLGTPLAWWLARSRWRLRFLVEALVALPLVLPPTVLGFYLLIALGPAGPLAPLLDLFGIRTLAFSFTGLLIGSVFYSLPFVVQPLQNAFSLIGERPLEAAATLRASPLDRFLSIAVPMARPGYLTAAVLGFAHTLGEFGVVLMIGGNIPGETQVLSIAIYDHVEALDYAQAHLLSGGLLVLSFLMLLAIYAINRRSGQALGMTRT